MLTHKGPIAQLGESLHWFILHWLPESAYRGLDGFELERYAPGFDGQQPDATMEYWLPVAPVREGVSPRHGAGMAPGVWRWPGDQ